MTKSGISLFSDQGFVRDNKVLSSAGRGVIKVGTVVGAGILFGMGFSAFKDASEGR